MYYLFNKFGLKNKIIIAVFMTVILLAFAVHIQSAYSIGAEFNAEQNLSNTNRDSTKPQIVASDGTDVHMVWIESGGGSDPEVFYVNSTDNGDNFDTPILLTSTLNGNVGQVTVPQIAISGTYVYAIWQDQDQDVDADTDIFISISSDSGDNFDPPINLSDGSASFDGNSVDPRIAVSGSNVYVIWRDFSDDNQGDIYFRASTDNGNSFSPLLTADPINLSDSDTIQSDNAEIVANQDSVFVVWEEGSNEEISFRGSSDNGDNFTPSIGSDPTELSANGDGDGITPAIVSSGNIAHVIWIDEGGASGNVRYRQISDDGGGTFSFSPLIGSAGSVLGDGLRPPRNPEIETSGSRVYAAWEEIYIVAGLPTDIFFTNSTDNGASWSDPDDISENSDSHSNLPQLDASGDNVYLIWNDDIDGSSTNQIFAKASFSTGSVDFGNKKDITDGTSEAITPQIAADDSNVYAIWDDEGHDPDVGTDSEILFSSGVTTSVDIGFDNPVYRISESATVTVEAPNEDTSIDVTITSDVDSTGITIPFDETGVGTGIFEEIITFTESGSSSGTTLLVSPLSPNTGITASFDGQTGTSNIFTRTASFDFASYTLGSIAGPTIEDENSNTNDASKQEVTVTISSANAPSGISNPITMTLQETEVDSGIFGTLSSSALIFQNGFDAITIGKDLTITETANDGNPTNNVNQQDSATVNIESSLSDVDIILQETGLNTGIFKQIIKFITGDTSGTSIQAAGGDYLRFEFEGFQSRVLLLPNSNSSKGALRVSVTDVIDDTITISFDGATGSADVVGTGGLPGGGGGGLVRPGLVLDILAGAVATSGGGAHSPPVATLSKFSADNNPNMPDNVKTIVRNYDPKIPIEPIIDDPEDEFDFPMSIDGQGYAVSGFNNKIKSHSLQVDKPTTAKFVVLEQTQLKHFTLYMNLADDEPKHLSNLYIQYNEGEITVHDPEGYFANANLKFKEDQHKKIFTIDMEFEKETPYSKWVVEAWDAKRRSTTYNIFDAVDFAPAQENDIIDAQNIPIEETPKTIPIEETPKTIPTYNSLEEKSVLAWAGYSTESISDKEILEKADVQGDTIPDWYKKNFGKWFFTEEISLDDLTNALKFFEERGLT